MYDPNKVVKCGCGLAMRQHEWIEHWRKCKYGCSVRVTQQDIESLEKHEAHFAIQG